MKKLRFGFTVLLLASILFSCITSFPHIHEHVHHLLPMLGLYSMLLVYLWQDTIGIATAKKGVVTSLAFFSLFMFVSVHVMPTMMLLDHHDAHAQTNEHSSGTHPCCIPALPLQPVTGVAEIPGYAQEITLEPEYVHGVAPVFSESTRSPPRI